MLEWDSPELKRIIKGHIRRSFARSEQHRLALNKARIELPPMPKKDGTPGKMKVVRFECASCKMLFPQKHVQVDHTNPAVPMDREELDMSYDELVQAICCSADNLQVICSIPIKDTNGKPSCHRSKSNFEGFVRRVVKQMKENKVFVDLNPLLLAQLELDYKDYLRALQKYPKRAKKKFEEYKNRGVE
jgi:hypothetical protein